MGRPDGPGRPRTRLGALSALVVLLAVLLPATASASVPSSFFGVSAVLPTDNDFQRMGNGGIGAYRLGIDWRNVQHTRKGGFNWASPDADVRHAAQNGMVPAPFLYGTPRFISKSATKIIPPTGSLEDLELWGAFAAAAARRYGPGGDFWDDNPYLPSMPVKQWIIWNEQNARAFWFPRTDPEDYAKLVKVSDDAISSVDENAKLSLGGMFGYPHDERSLEATDFLEAFYRVPGIEKRFETVNLHPYGAGVGTVRNQIDEARAAIRKAGDQDASILVGEIGWASGGPEKSPSVVGVAGQRNRIRQGMKMLISNRKKWDIVGAYVYVWRDFSLVTPCLWCPEAGLLTEDGESKPSWVALKQIIRSNR